MVERPSRARSDGPTDPVRARGSRSGGRPVRAGAATRGRSQSELGPREHPPRHRAAAGLPTRRVSSNGTIGFTTVSYKAGAWLAGQTVEISCEGGLVQIHHRGVLVATHARRHPLDKQSAGVELGRKPRPSRRSVSSPSVTRKVDSSGNVCFAGANYRVGSAHRRRQVQVAVVGDTVDISIGQQLIRSHKVQHDRTREHGALANPVGRPHRINAA